MLRGLGAYQSDSYYDPDRPSWLPNWIDTPTESAMKWGFYGGANVNTVYSDPIKVPAPAAPQTYEDMVGGWTPDKLLVADRKRYSDWKTTAIPDVPTEEGIGPIGWLLVIVGGVILVKSMD